MSTDTTLAFRLIVKDDKNATGADDVKVIDKYIPPPNQPPIASAGTDQTVNAGNKVTLDGSGSKDPDGSITSYSWKQTIGPIVILSSTDMRYKTFSAPHVLSTTTLVFTLTVTDDKGASGASDSVAITVKPQETTITWK